MFRGNHSLKFGADMRWQQTNGADSAGQQGLFAFNPNETALPTAAGRANSGNAFASFLLGAVDNASYNGLYVVPGLRYQYKALFAQDDWKISRKLTLNIGLRWDLFMPRHEHNTNISGFDPSLPNPGAGNLLGAIRLPGQRSGPRQHAAELRRYLLQGFRTAHRIRVPVGRAHGAARRLWPFLWPGQRQRRPARFAEVHLRLQCRAELCFHRCRRDSCVQLGRRLSDQLAASAVHQPHGAERDQRDDDRGGRRASARFPELPVQRAAGVRRRRLSLEVAYVGVKGTHLGNGLISINQVDPKYLSLGTLLTQSVTSAAAQAAGIRFPTRASPDRWRRRCGRIRST